MNDTLPWYKQFWPWFIIAFPAATVVAGFITLFIAIKHADSLVDDDYYKEGLAINTDLNREKLARDLGLSFEFSIDTETRLVEINLHSSTAYTAPEFLQLKLIHPINGKLDMEFPLQYDEQHKRYTQQYATMLDIDWLIEIHPHYLVEQKNKDNDWKLRSRRSELSSHGE